MELEHERQPQEQLASMCWRTKHSIIRFMLDIIFKLFSMLSAIFLYATRRLFDTAPMFCCSTFTTSPLRITEARHQQQLRDYTLSITQIVLRSFSSFVGSVSWCCSMRRMKGGNDVSVL